MAYTKIDDNTVSITNSEEISKDKLLSMKTALENKLIEVNTMLDLLA